MTPSAYRVNLATMLVDNWLADVTTEQADHYTTLSQGFVWIPTARFAVTTATPTMGDKWDGATPASFVPAAVSAPTVDPTKPTTHAQAFAAIDAAQIALDTAIANAAALVTTV